MCWQGAKRRHSPATARLGNSLPRTRSVGAASAQKNEYKWVIYCCAIPKEENVGGRGVVCCLLPVDGSGAAVRVFPNPASGVVTLSAQGLPAGVRAAELVLYDALGREVLRQGVAMVDGGILRRLDLASMPSGVYFWSMRAASGEELGVGRVVKR